VSSSIRPNNARSRRVCVVGSSTHFLSGISYYTRNLANAFAERNAVSVILMRALIPARLYPGKARVGSRLSNLEYRDDIDVFDGVNWYWGLTMLRAVRFIRNHKPDVIVFQWWTGAVLHSYLVLAIAARLLGARVVVEFHEMLDTGEAKVPLAARYVRWGIRPLLTMASSYAVHSEFDKAQLRSSYRIGTKPIAVVPHGPYPAQRAAAEAPDRRRARTRRILYFGTIRPYKGVEYLIEAFSGLSDIEVRDFSLTVVGETWEGWTKPAQLISQSPHASSIRFENRYVTDDEADAYFADADIVVLPYLRSSASGPLHMAMARGLPVVVTSVGGLTEVANRYEGSWLVPPRDADSLRHAILEIASSARVRYEDPHSWSRSAQLLEALFDDSTGDTDRVPPGSNTTLEVSGEERDPTCEY
jgi:glycosyltransferase involved in cell wall biosynthesis